MLIVPLARNGPLSLQVLWTVELTKIGATIHAGKSRPDLKLLVLGFLGNVACIVEFEHDYESFGAVARQPW